MLIPLCLLPAFAAAPTDDLRPVAAPPDVATRRRAQSPDAPPLVCEPLVPAQVQLCFRWWDDQRNRRWVTPADLQRWAMEPAELRRAIVESAPARVREALERRTIEGMSAGPDADYFVLRDADGWAVGALLDPALVAARLGGGAVRVAIPSAGVAIAWPDPQVTGIGADRAAELDRILAIAVHEIHRDADDAVSPMVYVWRDGRPTPFAKATPSTPKETVP